MDRDFRQRHFVPVARFDVWKAAWLEPAVNQPKTKWVLTNIDLPWQCVGDPQHPCSSCHQQQGLQVQGTSSAVLHFHGLVADNQILSQNAFHRPAWRFGFFFCFLVLLWITTQVFCITPHKKFLCWTWSLGRNTPRVLSEFFQVVCFAVSTELLPPCLPLSGVTAVEVSMFSSSCSRYMSFVQLFASWFASMNTVCNPTENLKHQLLLQSNGSYVPGEIRFFCNTMVLAFKLNFKTNNITETMHGASTSCTARRLVRLWPDVVLRTVYSEHWWSHVGTSLVVFSPQDKNQTPCHRIRTAESWMLILQNLATCSPHAGWTLRVHPTWTEPTKGGRWETNTRRHQLKFCQTAFIRDCSRTNINFHGSTTGIPRVGVHTCPLNQIVDRLLRRSVLNKAFQVGLAQGAVSAKRIESSQWSQAQHVSSALLFCCVFFAETRTHANYQVKNKRWCAKFHEENASAPRWACTCMESGCRMRMLTGQIQAVQQLLQSFSTAILTCFNEAQNCSLWFIPSNRGLSDAVQRDLPTCVHHNRQVRTMASPSRFLVQCGSLDIDVRLWSCHALAVSVSSIICPEVVHKFPCWCLQIQCVEKAASPIPTELNVCVRFIVHRKLRPHSVVLAASLHCPAKKQQITWSQCVFPQIYQVRFSSVVSAFMTCKTKCWLLRQFPNYRDL